MKVFISRGTGGYGDGCALVAANTPEEAWKIASEDKEGFWFKDWDYDNNDYVPSTHYMSSFMELKRVTYDGTEPKILAINIYFE